MKKYLNYITNTLQSVQSLSVKQKKNTAYSLLVLCAVLFGGAIATSYGLQDDITTSYADSFAKTKGDTINCLLHGAASTSYYGTATSSITYNPKDLKGEQGKDWAKTVNSDYFALNNSNNRVIAQRRNGKATEVAVAPGMNVQLNTHFLNHTGSSVSVNEVNYNVGDLNKLIASGTNTQPITAKQMSVIYDGKTITKDMNVMTQKTSIVLAKDNQSVVGPIFSFQAKEPVTSPKAREVKYEYKDGKTYATVYTTIQNNMNEPVSSITIETPVKTNDVKTIQVSLAANETKTIEQKIDLGISSEAVTTLPKGVIKINQSFTSVLAKASPYTDENGKISTNDIKNTTMYFSRTDNGFTGTQWGNVNQVNDLKVTIIPYSLGSNELAIPKPIVEVKPVETKIDLKLVKTINDGKLVNVKAGEELTIKLRITNVGTDKTTGFEVRDILPECVDLNTIKVEGSSDYKIEGNTIVIKKLIPNGFNPQDISDIQIKYKLKTDCECKDLMLPARVNADNYSNKKEENYMNYDFKDGCKNGDNNCDSVQIKVECKAKPEITPTPVPEVKVPKILDVTLNKSIVNPKGQYNQGDDIKFNLEFKNISNSTTTGFAFQDTLKNCVDHTKLTIDNFEYDKSKLTITELKIDANQIIAKVTVKDGFSQNAMYNISYNAKLKSDCKCEEIISPARVNVEGYSDIKEENFQSYNVVTDVCKANDNNCSTVKYVISCPIKEVAKVLEYSITRSIENKKSVYTQEDQVVFNSIVTKVGDLETKQFKITETLPKELDIESYEVAIKESCVISNLTKIKNLIGTSTITYVVTCDKNINNGAKFELKSSAKVKIGAKCINPLSPIRVDTTNGQVETPETNVLNGMCSTANVDNCTPCNSTTTMANSSCELRTCVTGDNNCAIVIFNLDCQQPTPITITPRPVTPRTGGLQISLSIAGMVSLLGAALFYYTNRANKLKINL
jgi:hypothetical protein